MKFKFYNTGPMVLVVLFLALSLFSTANFVEAADGKEQKLISEAKASVKADIPIFQSLKIIKKPNINYSFLMQNYNGSAEIIVEDALTVEVLSNTKWHLRLSNRNLYTKVMIKKSNQSNYDWQSLTSTTAKFRGKNGVQQITFDLKFILAQSSRAAVDDLALDLRHSLVPELY